MSGYSPVAIIGAGPYGLSVAAHLSARGIEHRIFGHPMHSWCAQMPSGMYLKSEGFASDLYDPAGELSLRDFCAASGLEYAEYNCPVPLDTFVSYGLAFQRRLVPHLEDKMVTALEWADGGFSLRLDDGETLTAGRVVVAAGLSHFRYIPTSLVHLPPELLTHSSDHRDLSRFSGRTVSVIGGGASAIDLVAALREAGADVRLIARRRALKWNTPAHRPGWKQWYPMSGLGGGWQNRFYESAPILFSRLPEQTRLRIVRTWLGPAGAWPVRECVEQAPLMLGHTLHSARLNGSGAYLHLADPDGVELELATDHVIAATGYRVDLRRVAFLDNDIRAQIRTVDQAPALSPDFQSSVPGLYFLGLASANTFGPVMRFLLGARHAARRLTKHFANGAACR